MRAAIIMVLKGFLVLTLCVVLCTVGWEELIKDKLYHCLEPRPMDFLRPGDWIHGTIAGGTGNYSDWIRPGWGMTGIWAVWGGCVVACVAVSVALAILPWRRSRRYYR